VNYYFETNRGPISIEISYDEISKINDSEITIYTCNTNSYSPNHHFNDVLQLCKNNNYSYYVFTDKVIYGFNIKNQILFTYTAPDPRYAAKLFKILPHQFFKKSTYTLWVDANILLNEKVNHLIENFKSSNKEILLFNHNKRRNILEESEVCIKYAKDDDEIIKNQISKYKKLKLQIEEIGLFQGGVLLRKNTANINNILKLWWCEIREGSIRDQLSLPIIVHDFHNKSTIRAHEDLFNYFSVIPHNKYKMYGIGNSLNSNVIAIKSKILYYFSKFIR